MEGEVQIGDGVKSALYSLPAGENLKLEIWPLTFGRVRLQVVDYSKVAKGWTEYPDILDQW